MLVVMLALSGCVLAGNVPQYKYEKGTVAYNALIGATTVSSSFEYSGTYIYADGAELGAAEPGPGFDIGFDFILGGQKFNQVVIGNSGVLYFGYDIVDPQQAFKVQMLPVMNGVEGGNISYKTEGDEGNRIFTVQYAGMVLIERGTSGKGKFNLQIRLYESNGKVEFAFQEVETCYGSGFGFFTGIKGWDNDDVILLTSAGIDKDVAVSPSRKTDVLNRKSYIYWDNNDYDKYYSVVYSLSPVSDKKAPKDAPENLMVKEEKGNLKISCRRADDAAATVLLYSNTPFETSDLPVDGETFAVGSKMGNSIVLYYSDGANPSAVIENIKPATDYYICAISANGYPAYGCDDRDENNYITLQAPPSAFNAEPGGTNSVKLGWTSDYPVIIAKTTQHSSNYGEYSGQFGHPAPTVKAGDVIPGGGEVVFVGDGNEAVVSDIKDNSLVFFRAWTLKDGSVSSSGIDSWTVTHAVLPYAPDISSYPFGAVPYGWIASCSGEDVTMKFSPIRRMYDNELALWGKSYNAVENRITTPELPLDAPVKLSFEYALETFVLVNDEPRGNKPGVFGEGNGLYVKAGETGTELSYCTIDKYEGTMTATSDGYETGSSTFEKVEVDIPAVGEKGRISISFASDDYTTMYIRNIRIEKSGDNGVSDVNMDNDIKLYVDKGVITIISLSDTKVPVYSVDGREVVLLNVHADLPVSALLQSGVYIVNGKKIVVR
ncbi:hypothetical protein [Xylanibacter muris]|nr:hypothetical protein [Xylanibacter muris]